MESNSCGGNEEDDMELDHSDLEEEEDGDQDVFLDCEEERMEQDSCSDGEDKVVDEAYLPSKDTSCYEADELFNSTAFVHSNRVTIGLKGKLTKKQLNHESPIASLKTVF
jgi:hypothetical protein